MKKTGILFLILCVATFAILLTLMNVGYLSSKNSLLAFWLVGLVILSAYAIVSIKYYISRIKKLSPVYQPLHHVIKNVTDPSKKHVLMQKSLKEIKEIKKNKKKEIQQIFCNPKFREIVSFWDQPDTMATFYAIDSMKELCNKWLDKDFSKPILSLFSNSLIEKESVFSIYDNKVGCWYLNKSNRNPTLEAAHAILRTAGDLLWIKRKKCTYQNLASIVGKERIGKFEELFRNECIDKTTGGFKDIKENEATIPSTGLGIRIASYLYGNNGGSIPEEKLKEIFKFREDATPSKFIENCMRVYEQNGKEGLGFKLSIGDKEEPKVCIGYFAIVSLKKMGKLESIKTEENQKLMANFLDECLQKETQGYTAFPEFETEDLMHTYYALRTALIIYPEYLKEKDENFFSHLGEFVDSCKSGDGYSFRPGYEPNVFTTCIARVLSKLIAKYNNKGHSTFDPLDSLKFYMSCYNSVENAFAGYKFDTPS